MEQVIKIEELVSNAVGVNPCDIFMMQKSPHRTARKFIWYILHEEMNYKLNFISERYGKTTRAIMYGISDIRFGLRTQKYYREIYSEIAHLRAIKEGSD